MTDDEIFLLLQFVETISKKEPDNEKNLIVHPVVIFNCKTNTF